jgi:hypothetical protein
MRFLTTLLGVFALSSAASGDVLWNNFQGPDGFDGVDSLSSERRTEVTESWTVDDAIFPAAQFPLGVEITGIRWIGVRTPGTSLFPLADFAILDSSLNQIAGAGDDDVSYTVEATLPSTDFPGLEVYRGFVSVPNVPLAPGRYYFGARLVGNFFGRNFIATTGNGAIQGVTQGYFQSVFFGFPNFVPAAQAFKAGETDFAYQIEGVPIVPEPATLLLVAGGALAALRRR